MPWSIWERFLLELGIVHTTFAPKVLRTSDKPGVNVLQHFRNYWGEQSSVNFGKTVFPQFFSTLDSGECVDLSQDLDPLKYSGRITHIHHVARYSTWRVQEVVRRACPFERQSRT